MPFPRPAARPLLSTTAVAAALLLTMTAAASADTAADSAERSAKRAFSLTLLHINDGESALLGLADGADDGQSPGTERPYGGVSRAASLMDRLRDDACDGKPRLTCGVVALSGGDNYLPGAQFSAGQQEGAPFYDAVAVEGMDLDASAIGNHEFDYGPDVVADFIDHFDGDLPFVGANLDMSKEERLAQQVEDGVITKNTIVRKGAQRVGIIGITTPELPTLSTPGGVVVSAKLAEIANEEAAKLKRRGVTQVVLVSHLQDIDNELKLVPELKGIDAVLGAGGGEILADEGDAMIPGDTPERGYPLTAKDADGRSVPVATTTGNYKYIGKLVLDFDVRGRLIGVNDDASRPVPVTSKGDDAVDRDPELVKSVDEPVQSYLDSLGDNVLARSEVPLNGVRDDVRSKETNLGDLLADSLLWSGRQEAGGFGVPEPVVGIQNGGGIRNDSVLPAGDFTSLAAYEVAPFPNFVAVVPEVPRDTFRQLLERGVAASPEAAGPFIQIAGAKFSYDTSKTAQVVNGETGEILTPGERVQSVVLDDGTEIVKDGAVVDGAALPIATQDFSARGGDAYPLGGLDFTIVGKTYQDALSGYVSTGLSGVISKADYPEGGEGRITPIG